jgi:hypothetical protein
MTTTGLDCAAAPAVAVVGSGDAVGGELAAGRVCGIDACAWPCDWP